MGHAEKAGASTSEAAPPPAAERRCSTEPVGDIAQFGRCKAIGGRDCRHALPFGDAVLCTRPDWRKFSSSPR